MSENTFNDINDGDWYKDDVLKNNKAGNILGDGENIRPNDFITREEFAVIICKALYIDPVLEETGFNDDSEISDWAKGYVNALHKSNYINGRENNNFEPKAFITRAEVVKVLDSACNKIYTYRFDNTENINSNVVISGNYADLKNTTINGNLILSPSLSKEKIVLDNVKVNGKVVDLGNDVKKLELINGSVINQLELNGKYPNGITVSIDEKESVPLINVNTSSNVVIDGNGDYKVINLNSESNITINSNAIIEKVNTFNSCVVKNDGRIVLMDVVKSVPSVKTNGVGVTYMITTENLSIDADIRLEKLILKDLTATVKITDKVFKVQDVKGNDIKDKYYTAPPAPEKPPVSTRKPTDVIPPNIRTSGDIIYASPTATCKFTSDSYGKYYYVVLPILSDEPTVNYIVENGIEGELINGMNKITVSGLSGCHRLLVVAEDDEGNLTKKYISYKLYDNWRYVNGDISFIDRVSIDEESDRITFSATSEFYNSNIAYVCVPQGRETFGEITIDYVRAGKDNKGVSVFTVDGNFGTGSMIEKEGVFSIDCDKDFDYNVYAVIMKNGNYTSVVKEIRVDKLQ